MGRVREWTRDIQAEVTLRHEGRKVCPPEPPRRRESFVGQRHNQNCSEKLGGLSARVPGLSLLHPPLSWSHPTGQPDQKPGGHSTAPRPRKAEQIWGNRGEGTRTPVILPITQEGIGKVISHCWGWEGELSPKGGSCTLNHPCNYIRIWAGLVIPWTTLTEGDEKPRIRKVKLGKVIKENIFHNVEV